MAVFIDKLGIRTGRSYLLNGVQAIAVMAVCCLSLGLWPLVSNAGTIITENISLHLNTFSTFCLVYCLSFGDDIHAVSSMSTTAMGTVAFRYFFI